MIRLPAVLRLALSGVLALVVLTSAGLAWAESGKNFWDRLSPRLDRLDTKRLYMAGYLGLSVFPDADYTDSVTPVTGVVALRNSNLMAGALGIRLTPEIDVEVELSYRKPDVTSITPSEGSKTAMGGEIRTAALMFNGFYNFDPLWMVQPFVTAGVGVASHSGEFDDVSGITVDSSDTDMGLAYQIGGGVKYRMRKDLKLTTGYRYFGTTEMDFGSSRIGYGSHEFRLGLEYEFPHH
jgi:opacity protein-like surface antigen